MLMTKSQKRRIYIFDIHKSRVQKRSNLSCKEFIAHFTEF